MGEGGTHQLPEGASGLLGVYEGAHAGGWGQRIERSPVPTGVAAFSTDVAIRRYVEAANTITHWSDIDAGGHFAAMEAPDLFIGDVRAFFRTVR